MAAGSGSAVTIRQVFLVLFAVQLACIGILPTTDPDMWWHLRTGELIWSSGIPRHDPFSFTRGGAEWITHEWLSQALMWPLYSAGGLELLAVAFACLSGLAFWLAYRCSEGQPYMAALPAALGAFAAAPSFGARPQVMNMLFMAGFVYAVERVRRGSWRRQALWLLPAATVVWVNLHSGYLLGVVLLATYAVGEAGEGLLAGAAGRRGLDLPRRLALAAAACLAAALINPSGWYIWLYPFDTLGSDLMQRYIVEWSSPDFHQWTYWPFAALLGLGAVSFAVSPKRPPLPDLLLFLGAGAAGLVSRRHIALFAIAATPVIARALTEAVRDSPAYAILCQPRAEDIGPAKAWLNRSILVAGIAAMLSWKASVLARNDAAIAEKFPVSAVDYLQRAGMSGARGFNSYGWGGYLIWRGLPVFIDGRADVHGELVDEYLDTFHLREKWRDPLARHAIEYVLIEKESALSTLLASSADWDLTYSDQLARIYVRKRAAG